MRLLLPVSLIAIVPGIACAQVTFSSYPPGRVFPPGGAAWHIGVAGWTEVVCRFTAMESGDLQSVDLALSSSYPQEHTRITMYADSGSGPGAIMASWDTIIIGSEQHYQLGGTASVAAGQSYYFGAWDYSLGGLQWDSPASQGVAGEVWRRNIGGNPSEWESAGVLANMPAFELTVPAPASCAPLFLIGTLLTARRRNPFGSSAPERAGPGGAPIVR